MRYRLVAEGKHVSIGAHAPTALKASVRVATAGKSEAAIVAAAAAILDRGYGKERLSIDMRADMRNELWALSDEELEARLAVLLGEARADGGDERRELRRANADALVYA